MAVQAQGQLIDDLLDIVRIISGSSGSMYSALNLVAMIEAALETSVCQQEQEYSSPFGS